VPAASPRPDRPRVGRDQRRRPGFDRGAGPGPARPACLPACPPAGRAVPRPGRVSAAAP